MTVPSSGRWPPAYDAAELARQIKDLAAKGELFQQFYWDVPSPQEWCQGDVVRLSSPFPYLDADGNPAILEGAGIEYWLLLSNSCDLDRSVNEMRWLQLVPLFDVQPDAAVLSVLQQYEYSRRFYVPGWPENPAKHFVAEFTMPVSVERVALGKSAQFVAHLSQYAWVLLHSCIIRFLARDDGRFDTN